MKNTIKVERAKRDLTQQALAEAIGVSRQTINSIETRRFVPSTLLALQIAAVFGVAVGEIFSLEEEEIPGGV
jgi:putative transcriptional regulator